MEMNRRRFIGTAATILGSMVLWPILPKPATKLVKVWRLRGMYGPPDTVFTFTIANGFKIPKELIDSVTDGGWHEAVVDTR
jgi:hypothetical protein